MFSGIVVQKSEIVALDLAEKWGKLSLRVDKWEPPLEVGESICVWP